MSATVVDVAYDDALEPYYEITLNADGRDKSTVGERLRPAPTGRAPAQDRESQTWRKHSAGQYEQESGPIRRSFKVTSETVRAADLEY